MKVSYNWLRLMLQEAGVVEREPRYVEAVADLEAAVPSAASQLEGAPFRAYNNPNLQAQKV